MPEYTPEDHSLYKEKVSHICKTLNHLSTRDAIGIFILSLIIVFDTIGNDKDLESARQVLDDIKSNVLNGLTDLEWK